MTLTKNSLNKQWQRVISLSKKICSQDIDNICRLEHIAIETSINAIAFADMNRKVTYVNRAMLDLFGYKSKAEVIGRSTDEFFADKKIFLKTFRLFTKQSRWVGEIQMCKKDGSVFDARISSNQVKDEKNRPLCSMAFIEDITETKRTIEALKQSEKNFKNVFYGAAEGIIVADIKTKKFKLANPAACKMFGYSEQEMLRLSVINIHPKDSIRKIFINFHTQIKGKKTLAPNSPCIRKDGSIFFADINAAKVLLEDKEYAAGFFTDITERLIAEQQIRKAKDELETKVLQRTAQLEKVNRQLQRQMEERLRAEKERANIEKRFKDIFDNALVGIYRTTPDGRILMANPALMKMLGYRSFDELKKRDLEKTGFGPSYPRSFFKKIMKQKGFVTGLESVWLTKDSGRIILRESAVTVKDEAGKIIYYEGTVEDITERKKAEEKLLAYQKELRSLALELTLSEERLRRQIAVNIHDHLGQNLALSKIKLDGLKKNIKTGLLIKKLDEIRELLNQTIGSARTLTFELSPPVLYELGFEAAVEWLLRFICKTNNLAWEFFNDQQPKPLLENVRVLLFQSVREILVNVTKHAHAKKIFVSVERLNRDIQVRIIDDGIGFDVNKKRLSEKKIKGFGLFSVNERLASIEGCFKIDSKPGAGTRVLLTAPLSRKK